MLPAAALTARVGASGAAKSARVQAPKAMACTKRWRTERTGPALRSGWGGVRATVFGATGFVGRYVVNMLGSQGHQVMVPFRGDDMEVRHLKVMGDYGMVQPIPFDPKVEDSVRAAIQQSDVVINLIGKDYETTHFLPWLVNQSFEDTHIKLAETIARIAVEEGCDALVHTSALAASPDSVSRWARTKAAGEQAVRAVCPGATIVRPAHIFGDEDKFLNLFARMYQFLPRIPLIDGGIHKVQPVFVHDVAEAIVKIALSQDPDVVLSQTYDIAGPEEYSYREVVEYVFETIRALNPVVANVPPVLAEAVGHVVGMFPTPEFSAETFRRMQEDVVLDRDSDSKRLHDLGIGATSMEYPGFSFLHGYRSGSHWLDVGEATS